MNIKNIDSDKLDKFIIKALEGYLDSNPKFLKIKLIKLISESILHLRKYIEDPKEKDITWDNPAIKLKYGVKYSDDEGELPFIFYEDDTQEKNTEEIIVDRAFHDYPLSILLRVLTDYVVVFKQGDKTEARVSPQYEYLNKLTGAKRERYLRELGEKYFSDDKKPTFTFDLEDGTKTAKGEFLLDVRPLFVDLDTGEANYTVTAGLNMEGYKPINWSKEEKKEFWETLDTALKACAPQESFDFIEKLAEPEVKPIIKDKREVYKQPKDLAKITQSIYTNIGFKDGDFKGYTKERGKDEAKWQKKELTALVLTEDLPLLSQRKKKNEGQQYLIPTPPKITVSQAKSMDTLCYMLQRENWRREKAGQDKTGNLEFSLEEYAKMRGKSDAQIAQAGSYLDELKRDLISGGVTSYIVDLEPTTGRKSYLIQNFYGLEVPKVKSKRKWRVIFNEPYKTDILNSKQFYPILLKAIQDTNTNERKGYLYYFYRKVMSYANTKTDFQTRLKVSTLLDYIKAGDRTKAKPKRAFNVLCECICYATKFKAIKEVRFFDSGKYEKVRVITDLEKFKDWDYTDFKNEVLNYLGLTDIREALVSFNSTPQKELAEVTEEPKQMGEYKTTL